MHDLIAIGDTVIDAFIKLKEATINNDIEKDRYTITMAFGDKIPYESVEVVRAVGNSANAAVAAARLGLSSALVSDMGDDSNGKECIKSLKNDGVSTDLISIHKNKKTNYHYVLWYENDRTILIKHEEYKYHLPKIGESKWLYLSSLGNNSLGYHKEITDWLARHQNVSLAFQPGTFQIKLGKDVLRDIYSRAKIFFSNVEEAGEILGIDTLGIEELLRRIHALGPEIAVITDGPGGAYAFDGETIWFLPSFPDKNPPFERTGAGDAFASTTVSALILGNNLPTALTWGAVNSMSVVRQVGAQKGLLSRGQIEECLKKEPSFQARKFR